MTNDLISREALFREWDKIDVDGKDPNLIIDEMIKVTQDAPAVETAPVVHCCACKYFEMDAGFCCYWETGTLCDDFCSRSAKMDEEET